MIINAVNNIWINFKYMVYCILHLPKYFPEYHDAEYKKNDFVDISASQNNILTEKWYYNNNRLFKNDILYCEGRYKSQFRGKLHLISLFTIFPFFIYKLCSLSFYNTSAFFIGMFNLLSIYIAHIISAIYHTTIFSVKNEIFIQKLDYIGLNWYIGTSYYPMAFLLFPNNIGFLLVGFSTIIMCKNSYDVLISKYAIFRPLFIVGLQIPFFTYIITYLNKYELICNFSGIFTLLCAGYIMIYNFCPPFLQEKINGIDSFEIYHVLSIICLLSTLLMNYSIVSRYSV